MRPEPTTAHEPGNVSGRRRAVRIVPLLVLFSCGTVRAVSPPGSPETAQQTPGRQGHEAEAPIALGFLEGILEGSLNEAKASVRAWVETMAGERNLRVKAEVLAYEDADRLRAAIRGGEVDMVILDAKTYLESPPDLPFDLSFVPVRAGRPGEQYLLLVHRESGIDRVGQLRGRSIVIQSGGDANYLAKDWLASLLRPERLPGSGAYFGTIKDVRKVSQAALPVFFRQSDACIVNRAAFETLAELNPQLGAQLRVLGASPEFVGSVIGFRRSCRSRVREELDRIVPDLHLRPQGQQILTVFRVEKLVPFEPRHLDTARDLLLSLAETEPRGMKGAKNGAGRAVGISGDGGAGSAIVGATAGARRDR